MMGTLLRVTFYWLARKIMMMVIVMMMIKRQCLSTTMTKQGDVTWVLRNIGGRA